MSREEVLLDSTKKILLGLLTKSGSVNKAGKLAILNNKVLEDQDVTSLTYRELKEILQFIDENVVPYINDKNTAGQDLLNRDLFNYGRKMRRDTISNSKVKLPAQKNEDGYFIDSDKEFSDDGFVPDWEWMDNYMKSLPYSDRI